MSELDLVRNSDVINVAGVITFFFVGNDQREKNSSLYARKEMVGSELLIYSSKGSLIYDFSIIRGYENSISILWREVYDNTSKSEIHHAELDHEFKLLKHVVLDNSPYNENCILPLCVRFGEYLLLTRVDVDLRKSVVSVYDLNGYSIITNEITLDHELHGNYFNIQQCYLANVTLTLISENVCYYQFITIGGRIITYELKWDGNAESLNVNELFELSYERMGFHRTLFDKHNSQLLIVYSEDETTPKNNNIKIIKQKVFGNISSGLQRAGSVTVNQSPGNHLRPCIIKSDVGYFISWEGNGVYYIELDNELNVYRPQERIEVANPGNVFAGRGTGLAISYQAPNVKSKDMGDEFHYNSI
ncbi:hypothetical protein I5M74_22605 [Serratia marcescens]|nr:hypothetical protein [Serratia marcescens]